MPRATPKQGWSPLIWQCRITLSPEHFDELAKSCRVPDQRRQKFRESIEEGALGLYHSEREYYDEAPRPANIRAGLEPLFKAGYRFLRKVGELDKPSEFELLRVGYDPSERRELTRRTEALLFAAQEALHKLGFVIGPKGTKVLPEAESRHRPVKIALRELVRRLAAVFDRFAEIAPDQEPERRECRLDFIEEVLEAANASLEAEAERWIEEQRSKGRRSEQLPAEVRLIEAPGRYRLGKYLDESDRASERPGV